MCEDLNYAYIMRGIPGSGKSTVARRIARTASQVDDFKNDIMLQRIEDGVHYFSVAPLDEGWEYMPIQDHIKNGYVEATIHSTDNFFLVDGEYRFDPRQLGKNHQKNMNAFRKSIELGIGTVICDNTNTTIWEFKKYLTEARRAGYVSSVITLPHPPIDVAVERNTHDVPRDAIEKMLRRWEPWAGTKKK
jgi:hypothetical protein